MAKIIVKDNVDIDTIIDPNTSIQDGSTQKHSIEDSTIEYSTVDLRHQHLKIFSLITTSDKEINLRMYPDEHVQDMIKRNSWLLSYPKPLNLDHISRAESQGRFIDNWYIDNKTLDVKYGVSKMPQKVIDEFSKRGAFNDGTGSAIGMLDSSNLDLKRKIIDGTYVTTSMGAATDSLTCNICGHQYYDYGNCRHTRGSTYPILSEDGKTIKEMRRCVPFTGPLEGMEDSIVGTPANDTSTIMVYDTKKDTVIDLNNIKDYSTIFNILTENTTNVNNDNSEKPNVEDSQNNKIEDNKVAGLTIKQIEDISKLLSEGKTVSVEILNQDSQTTENVVSDKTEEATQTPLNTEDKKNEGGKKMDVKKVVKKTFKDECHNLKVTDENKVNDYFQKLTDEELGTVMEFLDFISENRVTEVVEDTQETKPTTTQDTTETVVEKVEDKNATAERIKQLEDELAKIKGIDNSLPNISTNDNKEKTEKTEKTFFDI